MLDKYLTEIQDALGRVPKFIRTKCTGAGECIEVCPVNAISGNPNKKQIKIDSEKCVKCGACIESCPSKAIV